MLQPGAPGVSEVETVSPLLSLSSLLRSGCGSSHWRAEANCSTERCPLADQVYQYAKDNFVLFNTFIKDPYGGVAFTKSHPTEFYVSVKKFLKDEKITWISYIANAGGLLGLCMGFSLVKFPPPLPPP